MKLAAADWQTRSLRPEEVLAQIQALAELLRDEQRRIREFVDATRHPADDPM